jgi:hypothetical protein
MMEGLTLDGRGKISRQDAKTWRSGAATEDDDRIGVSAQATRQRRCRLREESSKNERFSERATQR